MKLEDSITITDFCASHEISHALVIELREYGLVDIIEAHDTWYIPIVELPKAEKILRLYSDLDINLEGLAVVTQLLDRIARLQNEVDQLKNRLHFYE